MEVKRKFDDSKQKSHIPRNEMDLNIPAVHGDVAWLIATDYWVRKAARNVLESN